MASAGYQVVVARLMENGVENLATKAEFNEQYGTLMSIIRTAYTATMITNIKSLDLRTMFRPKVILLVTDEITKHENVQYRSKLAKFVEEGGTLILCCWFVSKSTTWGIEGILWEFRECDWTVAEGSEASVITDVTLNKAPAMKQKFGDHAFGLIKDTYSMQAVNLKGVATNDQVYRAFFPAAEPLDKFADVTPSAYHKYGRGYLGYVGDIKLEEGTKELIVAMLEASISPFDDPNNNKPANSNQPHPKPQGQFAPPQVATSPAPQKSPSAARSPKPAKGLETMGSRTTGPIGKGSPATAKTGARLSPQNVSLSPHGQQSHPSLPAMDTSIKMLVMRNGRPIVTSMNAIADSSMAMHRERTSPQARRSDGGGRPMLSFGNLAVHTHGPPKFHVTTLSNFDRDNVTISNKPPSPMSKKTSQPQTSEKPLITAAAIDIKPYESPQSFLKDSMNVNAGLSSSQAVADPKLPPNASQLPITLPSLKPVAQNDITALHQFKKADSDLSTDEDSYGGGLTIPSIRTDLSGPPPFSNSHADNAQLANDWNAEVSERHGCNSNEMPANDDNGKTNGETNARMPDDHSHASNQASIPKHVSHTDGVTTHQKNYDDDDLYEASITASESKTFKAKVEIHAHQAPATPNNTATNSKSTPQTQAPETLNNTATDSKSTPQTQAPVTLNNTATDSNSTPQTKKNVKKISPATNARISKSKLSRNSQMPILASCNAGCVVCTILRPAKMCTGCRRVQYCSALCQKADWEEHKAVCGPQSSTKKSEESVNSGIQELMFDSQSEDFDYGDEAIDGNEGLNE